MDHQEILHMQTRPDVSNPFHSVYQVAEQLCAEIPPGTEINEVCIIGTIGGYALSEGARLDRAEMLPIVAAMAIVFGAIIFFRRNKIA
jgi:hypothetical protein